jgi:glycosyltransferase involved in cell wall biosynthesis
MHVFRNIDRDTFDFDFLVHTSHPAVYDDEIRELGGRVLACKRTDGGGSYAKDFVRHVRRNGPYDVIHSHVHHFSGVTLPFAKILGIPNRIAHSHTDSSTEDARSSLSRSFYLRSTKAGINYFATKKLSPSELAAASLFGKNWRDDRRCQLLHYGIALSGFQAKEDERQVRRSVGVPVDAKVVGHVGRFVAVKNHQFIVRIAEELLELGASVCFLLVGDGELRLAVEGMVRDRGVENHFVFAQSRDDVPRLMSHAMDVFILPSLYEGLPLVGIEAQAAGLPTLLSDAIARETSIVGELVEFLSIDDARQWAIRIESLLFEPPTISKAKALEAVKSSTFNIDACVEQLVQIYHGK